MRIDIPNIFRVFHAPLVKKWILWAIYLILLILVIPLNIHWAHRITFVLYALFVFSVFFQGTLIKLFEQREGISRLTVFWKILLVFSGIYLLTGRLFMFFRYGETPLGYDTGFYWQYFNLIAPLGTSEGALGTGNIAYTSWFPYSFIGLSALSTIHFLHILHQILTAGALYFLLRSLPFPRFSREVGIMGVFLFALSVNQFMAFWWMFYKQSMALPFLLLAVGLFLRRSWLAIPTAAFGAAVHLQSVIPFGIAFIFFFLYQILVRLIKKQPMDRELLSIGLAGIAAGLFVVALKSPKGLIGYFEYFMHYGGFASNALDWEIQQAKGLFIPFSTFQLNALFSLPFAITGILTMRSWLLDKMAGGRVIILPILLASSLILSLFPFLYQNRSLILLDILFILFAAYPIVIFVEKFLHDRTGWIILGLFFIGFTLFTSRVIWNTPPQIYAEEAREIKAIAQLRKPGDYAMAISSLYTPWVFAYTEFQETIAPGWLYWDRWNLKMWQEFWNGSSNARRLELLNIYGNHDIYIFTGNRFTLSPNLKEFFETDPHFAKISPHIWKYTPLPKTPDFIPR